MDGLVLHGTAGDGGGGAVVGEEDGRGRLVAVEFGGDRKKRGSGRKRRLRPAWVLTIENTERWQGGVGIDECWGRWPVEKRGFVHREDDQTELSTTNPFPKY